MDEQMNPCTVFWPIGSPLGKFYDNDRNGGSFLSINQKMTWRGLYNQSSEIVVCVRPSGCRYKTRRGLATHPPWAPGATAPGWQAVSLCLWPPVAICLHLPESYALTSCLLTQYYATSWLLLSPQPGNLKRTFLWWPPDFLGFKILP